MNAAIDPLARDGLVLQAVRQIRSELRANARLRAGVLLIAATLWLWLILLLQDQTKVWRAEAEEAQAELDRLRPLRSAAQWPQRAEEARKHLEATRALLWTAASQGQAEAALQDTLRSWAEKSALPIRELSISSAGDNKVVAGAQPLRARLVVDMNRLPLMGLLAELGRSPRLMMVESLRLRPQSLPARAEIEVRVLYRPEERKL